MSKMSDEIIALDKKRMHAMGAKDIATLNAVLADDLVFTHASARVDTKAALIGNMVSGSVVYASVEPFDVSAIELGDTVVLTGRALVKGISNGVTRDLNVRFTDVYAKRNGSWQMVAWQSTPIAGE